MRIGVLATACGLFAACDERQAPASPPPRPPSIVRAGKTTDHTRLPEEIARELARHGEKPEQAYAWADALRDPLERARAMELVAWDHTATDLPLAVRAMEQIPTGESRNKLAAHLAAEWSTREPASAHKWAESRPESAERDEALAGWAIAIAEADGAHAAHVVSTAIKDEAIQNRAAVAVVQRWARHDPQAVADWINTFPEDEEAGTTLFHDAAREFGIATGAARSPSR